MFLKILKISSLILKISIIFILLCLIASILYAFYGLSADFDRNFPNGKGIYFFTEFTGLIIPHLLFFFVGCFWIILLAPIATAIYGAVSKNENYQEKYPLIAFIPILILWIFYFLIYVLDYGISFFYFYGGYDRLRSVDFF